MSVKPKRVWSVKVPPNNVEIPSEKGQITSELIYDLNWKKLQINIWI